MSALKKKRRYIQAKEGEWIQPRKRGYNLRCCDCGLVHRMQFRLIAHGKNGVWLQFRAWRDERSSAASRRRKHKCKCKP